MDFIKTNQFHSLHFFNSTFKANFPCQIAAFVAISKTQKRGELMRYLVPLCILQRTKWYVPEQFPSQESHQLR